jgi:epoxyqueuosine reductase
MRTGSVDARIQIPPTPRPYTDHHECCLFFAEGTCKKCISRFPVGAITEEGKDKPICYRHLFPVAKDYMASEYGFDGYCCGLCQTGVPYESKIPAKQEVKTDDFNETAKALKAQG